MSVNLTFRCAYCDSAVELEKKHKSRYDGHAICATCARDEWMFQAVVDHWDEIEPARQGAIMQLLTVIESLPAGIEAGLQSRLN